MTPLLILAGNAHQFSRWMKEHGKGCKVVGYEPVYIPANTIKYMGYKDCHFMRIGTFYEAGYHLDMFKYFDYGNVTEIKL